MLARCLFAMVAVAPTLMAQVEARNLKVRHCPAADSALGPKSAAWKGAVRAYVDSSRGEFRIAAAYTKRAPSVTGSAQVDGRRWSGVPPLVLTVFLRRKAVEGLVGLGHNPKVVVVVDDSTMESGAVKLGTFVAPSNYPREMLTLPVSTLLPPAAFLALARARSAYVMVEQAKVNPVSFELRNIAALYAVLACGTLD